MHLPGLDSGVKERGATGCIRDYNHGRFSEVTSNRPYLSWMTARGEWQALQCAMKHLGPCYHRPVLFTSYLLCQMY